MPLLSATPLKKLVPTSPPNVRIYILCHTAERLTQARSIYREYWAVPILMKYQDCTFENAFWKQLLEIKNEWISCDMVGVLGFSAYKKINMVAVHNAIVSKKQSYHHFWTNPLPIRKSHPHILSIMTDVCRDLGVAVPSRSFCNYFMSSPTRMLGFIDWFEMRAKPVVMAHPLIMTNSDYKDGKMGSHELLALCGVPYYPYVPFVFERLNISFFIRSSATDTAPVDTKPADTTPVDTPVLPIQKRTYTNVYIVGGVQGGGSSKFINDMVQIFPNIKRICSETDLVSNHITENDILLVQHIYLNSLTIKMLNILYASVKARIIVNIHDFFYLTDKIMDKLTARVHSAYRTPTTIDSDITGLFSNAELIIHPSQFTVTQYSKYFSSHNFVVSPHVDYAIIDSPLSIPPIHNHTINIGVLHEFSEYKGSEYIRFLKTNVSTHGNYTINYLIIGVNITEYKENEFFTYLTKYNIHCLALLNKWGETYCYTLSKYLKSGRPILYNSLGAVAERMPSKPHFFKVFDREVDFDDADQILLETRFKDMLDFVIAAPPSDLPVIDLTLTVPQFYVNLFTCSDIQLCESHKHMEAIHSYVKPFCIYFPQFHAIPENDLNFYPGMTDITNLIKYISDGNVLKLDSPDINTLNISSLEQYDQTHHSLVRSQINTAKKYGIYGFCIYYYWFSKNTVTNRNRIMEKCIKNFFLEDIPDFKVYFDWANEDWTSNPAFTENSIANISNIYTDAHIHANFINLSKYFTHNNYYKIDNKPVFNIHHPWQIPEECLKRIFLIFTQRSQALGFDGIHIVLNSMKQHYNPSFLFAPNYKDPQYKSDYTYLTSSNDEHNINTIFFSFNNTVRMYSRTYPTLVEITNSTFNNQRDALFTKIRHYFTQKRSTLNSIFLINSWNEWGENMAVEPGLNKKDLYLRLINTALMNCYMDTCNATIH